LIFHWERGTSSTWNNQALTVTHNLGADPKDLIIKIEVYTDALGDWREPVTIIFDNSIAALQTRGITIVDIDDTDAFVIQTGGTGLDVLDDSGVTTNGRLVNTVSGNIRATIIKPNLIATYADVTGTTVPIGSVMPWTTDTAPTGYLLCDGASKVVADNQDLFNVIGYDFGGSGLNFNVPKSDHDTGWLSTSTWTGGASITINHGMNAAFDEYEGQIFVRDPAVPGKLWNCTNLETEATSVIRGQRLNSIDGDLDNCYLQIRNINLGGYFNDSGGVSQVPTNWEYKVELIRKDMPANAIIRSENVSVGMKQFTESHVDQLWVDGPLDVSGKIDCGGGITVPVMHVQDQKASGTAGGTFTAGAWQTRDLTIELINTIVGASLVGNQIILPAGTYKIRGFSLAFAVGNHRIKLRDTDGSTDLLIGAPGYSHSAAYTHMTPSHVAGVFTLTAETPLEIQHRCATTHTTNGYGTAVTFGVVEIYSDVFIEKLA